MTRTVVIDRIEGQIAVVELEGSYVDLPVSCLPDGAREGDQLEWTMTLLATPSPDEPSSDSDSTMHFEL